MIPSRSWEKHLAKISVSKSALTSAKLHFSSSRLVFLVHRCNCVFFLASRFVIAKNSCGVSLQKSSFSIKNTNKRCKQQPLRHCRHFVQSQSRCTQCANVANSDAIGASQRRAVRTISGTLQFKCKSISGDSDSVIGNSSAAAAAVSDSSDSDTNSPTHIQLTACCQTANCQLPTAYRRLPNIAVLLHFVWFVFGLVDSFVATSWHITGILVKSPPPLCQIPSPRERLQMVLAASEKIGKKPKPKKEICITSLPWWLASARLRP